MWTSTLDLDPKRVLLTQVLGRFYSGAYFSSYAPLRVENLPRQALPATNWVRVRNRLAGICGSDLHFIFADGDFRIAPAAIPSNTHLYLGHEVIGEVIEAGDDVQHIRVGDRVVFQSGPNCLTAGIQSPCRSCATGNYTLCEHGALPGPEPIGGGWSEEMLLHELQLYPIPPSISDEQAVMLEPTAVALHAILRRIPQPGEQVLVIGGGTIGLLTLQVLRLLAPEAEISVMARHAFQVEQATRLGAAHIIYPQDPYAGVQKATGAKLFRGMFGNRTMLGGYDVIYDTIGTRKSVHHALRWTRARATVVLVGSTLHLMNLDLTPIWYREVTLLGSLGHGMECWPVGSSQQRSTFSIASELIELGHIHPERLVTHHFALNDYKLALQTASSKAHSRAIKVIFDYSLLPASVVPNVRASARQQRPAAISRPFESLDEPEEPPVTPLSVPAEVLVSPHKEAQVASATREEIEPSPANIDDDTNADTEVALPVVSKAALAARKNIATDVQNLVEVEPQPASFTGPATQSASHTDQVAQFPTSPTIPVPVTPQTPDTLEQAAETTRPEPVLASNNTGEQPVEPDGPVAETAHQIYEQPTEIIESVSDTVYTSDLDESFAHSEADTQPVNPHDYPRDEPFADAATDVQTTEVDELAATSDELPFLAEEPMSGAYELPPHLDEPLVFADEFSVYQDESAATADELPFQQDEPITGAYEIPTYFDEPLVSADELPPHLSELSSHFNERFAFQDESIPASAEDSYGITDNTEKPQADESEQAPSLTESSPQENAYEPAEQSTATSVPDPDALTATPATELEASADSDSPGPEHSNQEIETKLASETLLDRDRPQSESKRSQPRRKKNTRNLR